MNLSTNSTSLLQICSDGGYGASPNFMILVLTQLVLRTSLEASGSNMANAEEMSFRFVAKMATSSVYSRTVRWYGPRWIPGTSYGTDLFIR